MAILEVRDLRKSFDTSGHVLDGVTFDVSEGEVVSVIGPSGSGKSTLLRCITQLETPDSGEIFIDGNFLDRTDKKKAREIGLNVGLVFQNFNLFPHFSVMRNITEAQIAVLGRPKAEAEKKAEALLLRMGLESKAGSYPCELSGGQQQRVGIARALAMEPKILFFDEPTSALDPELTGEILEVIRELAKEKMTMVIVTHEMDFAREVSDKILFMDGGHIVASGSPEEVFDNTENERVQRFISRFRR